MRKNLLTVWLMLAVFGCGVTDAAAQYEITLPKITDIFKPKTKKPKTEPPKQDSSRQDSSEQNQPAQTRAAPEEPFEQAAFVISPSEIKTNPDAPKDYDAKFKQNDRAMVDYGRAVRVVAKSGGIYKVNFENAPEYFGYYRANAVYPYFDDLTYKHLVRDNEEVISPFLNCYAKKHNLDTEKVGYFGWRHDEMTVETIKERLQLGMPKMAQLERDLKSQLPARPNTFADITNNPAILEDIATNREEYARCVVARKESSKFDDSVWLKAHRDGIKKDLKEIEEYDPAARTTMGTYSEYMHIAVSLKEREKWLKEKNALGFKEPIDAALAPLAAALHKKLPTYTPKPSEYAVRNAAEEAKMKAAFGILARHQIFKIGLAQAAWLIDKNVLGIPNARYKNGVIYLRDSQADHPYCFAAYVNIIQNYAGGGTYGASYAKYIQLDLVGCPTK